MVSTAWPEETAAAVPGDGPLPDGRRVEPPHHAHRQTAPDSTKTLLLKWLSVVRVFDLIDDFFLSDSII